MSNNKETVVNGTEELAEKGLYFAICELIGVDEFHMNICLVLIAMLCGNMVLTVLAWSVYGRDIAETYTQLKKPGVIDPMEDDKLSEDGEERESSHRKID